jgi:hypothetical protein
VAVLLDLLQAGLEGVDDGHVTVQREDQGHVDVDALGQDGGDGLQPHKGGEDLDQDVVLIHLLQEVLGFGDRAGGKLQPLFLGLGLGLERLCQLLQMRRYSDTP